MKELEQKYIDILEQNDWNVSSYTEDGRVEIGKYSPLGEDFLLLLRWKIFQNQLENTQITLMPMNTQKCGLRQEEELMVFLIVLENS